MKTFVPLGFSCQSRFTVDALAADFRAMPYDWCITTREFVLRSLDQADGTCFAPPADQLKLFTMHREKTQGLMGDGIWLWHDFPRNGHAIANDWADQVNYQTKYPYLWERFCNRVRGQNSETRFVISNTQKNLAEFAASTEDFSQKFGLDHAFASALNDRLGAFGAAPFTLAMMIRDIGDYIDIVSKPRIAGLNPVFAGILAGQKNNYVASVLFQSAQGLCVVDPLVGTYENGVQIVKTGYDTAVVHAPDRAPWAVARPFSDGYLFAFAGRQDAIFRAVLDNGKIRFSNKTCWTRRN